ncbi:hypothetical protein PGTUg99_013321 [Puccinia graminis f. sp. tritici]|uniref:Uncharacterized protein n=1 Tax=Puccinia graminis f. sp. tritici TaxID=56615 RepID=A0A5B0S6L8_PUCGR|nr:hypothetical protein PGTUg99_013321 [Puccinia graminis f. sp. tritici]
MQIAHLYKAEMVHLMGIPGDENWASTTKSKSSGQYPLAIVGIHQQIVGIRNGDPEAISKLK